MWTVLVHTCNLKLHDESEGDLHLLYLLLFALDDAVLFINSLRMALWCRNM
jgi:hypothetical protein